MDFRRRVIAQPCRGSSARIFRRSRSRVPWTRSFGLLISVTEMNIQQLLSVSKGNFALTDESRHLRRTGIESLRPSPVYRMSHKGLWVSNPEHLKRRFDNRFVASQNP